MDGYRSTILEDKERLAKDKEARRRIEREKESGIENQRKELLGNNMRTAIQVTLDEKTIIFYMRMMCTDVRRLLAFDFESYEQGMQLMTKLEKKTDMGDKNNSRNLARIPQLWSDYSVRSDQTIKKMMMWRQEKKINEEM